MTPRQARCLWEIVAYWRDYGFSPSLDELRERLGLANKSSVFRLLTSLEARGFIRRTAHAARSIEVLRVPDERYGRMVHVSEPLKEILHDLADAYREDEKGAA